MPKVQSLFQKDRGLTERQAEVKQTDKATRPFDNLHTDGEGKVVLVLMIHFQIDSQMSLILILKYRLSSNLRKCELLLNVMVSP